MENRANTTIENQYPKIINKYFPDIVIDKFEFVEAINKDGILNLSFKEKNEVAKEFVVENLKPKGFFPNITVHEFEYNKQKFYLTIKRKRWLNIDNQREGFINWSLLKKRAMTKSLFTELRIIELV